MPKNLLITNCIPFDSADGETTSILIENGKIARIGRIDAVSRGHTLDARGRIVAPGFIDVHIQGAGGADTLDATPDALTAISKTCARFGVTGFLATTVFTPGRENNHLRLAAEYTGRDLGGARLLGVHLEGPFISPEKRGMILPECICPPSLDVLDEILDITQGKLRMMTIAPEPASSLDIVKKLAGAGVIAALGHCAASYDQSLAGFDAGISHVTHTFNAMPSIHHRSPGPLIAAFERDDITCQLITDGVHVHPAVVRHTFKTIGPARIIPITDGMQAMGLPDGRYSYNGVEYESRNGTARYKDGTLIGTALGLSRMVRNLVTFTGCSLVTAVKMATQNPADILGLADGKGVIETGRDADLIIIDDELCVHATIVAGEIAFQA